MYYGNNDKRGFDNIMKKAFVLISCDLGKGKDALTGLPAMSQIKEAHRTWHTYDIVTEVSQDNTESPRETATWEIGKIPAFGATLTPMSIEGQN